MKFDPPAIKEEGFDFYILALNELLKVSNRSKLNRRVNFRDATKRFGVVYHFPRKESYKLLRLMEKKGLLKIHKFNFIEILRDDNVNYKH